MVQIMNRRKVRLLINVATAVLLASLLVWTLAQAVGAQATPTASCTTPSTMMEQSVCTITWNSAGYSTIAISIFSHDGTSIGGASASTAVNDGTHSFTAALNSSGTFTYALTVRRSGTVITGEGDWRAGVYVAPTTTTTTTTIPVHQYAPPEGLAAEVPEGAEDHVIIGLLGALVVFEARKWMWSLIRGRDGSDR